MKYMKRFLSTLLAAAMAVSLAPVSAFAAPEGGGLRPSITDPAEAGEDYIGGIYAIDWGDTDWGKLGDADWTDAAELSAADLAARLEASGVNALAFDGPIEFEDGQWRVDDTPIPEADLGGITLDGNTIAFPQGDTALIIPSGNLGAFEAHSEAVFDIPDDSNVAVIAVTKEGAEPGVSYAVWGYDSQDSFTINTNRNGNLAVVNLIASAETNEGMLMNGPLYIGGTGTVAAVGGNSGSFSCGIYADLVHVDGAALIGTAEYSMESSRGIDTAKGASYSKEYTGGGITAENGALIIGVGGYGESGSVGIQTMNIAAENGSEIYAYGGTVPPPDEDDDNDMRTIGLQIVEGITKRTVTADNGSGIYARAGNGEFQYGIADYYTALDLKDRDGITPSELVYGGVEFVMDGSGNAAPSEIVAAGADDAYHQRRVYDANISKSQYKDPSGNVTAMGSLEMDGSDAIVTYFNARAHNYVYADHDGVDYLKLTRGEEADYYLVYDPEEGALYRYTDDTVGEGEKLESFPGAECDGDTLTLTDDFHFATSCEIGLLLGSDTTLVVPEGVSASVMSGDSPEHTTTAALLCGAGCNLEIDGTFAATGRGSSMGSDGILWLGVDPVSIAGEGTLYATGGDILDTSVRDAASVGIRATADINISGTVVRAASGYVSFQPGAEGADSASGRSVGLQVNGGVFADDGADVYAQGEGGGEGVLTYGCIADDITSKGSSFMAYADNSSDSTLSAGLALESGGSLSAANGGTVECVSLDYDAAESFGLYELDASEEDGPVTVTVDGNAASIHVWGTDAAVKLRDKPAGNYSVKCNQSDVSFDTEQGTFVSPAKTDGSPKPVRDLQFRAVPAHTVDFGLYYDAESGFRKNTKDGEALDTLPEGISANGDTLTLDYVVFTTTYETALTVGEGVTVTIPEGSEAVIKTESSAKNKIADGIVLLGGNTLEVDGELSVDVSGSDADNRAIHTEDDVTISGTGKITTSGGSDTPSAIYANGDLTFGESVYILTGRIKADDSEEAVLTLKDDAVLHVRGVDFSDAGITVRKLLLEDSAFISVYYGAVIVAGDEENPGEIRLRDTSSANITNPGGAALVGCYDGFDSEWSEGNTPIVVEDSADADFQGLPALRHAKAADGTTAVGGDAFADDYELRYDDESFTYVVAQTGEEAKYVRFTKQDAVDYPLYFDGETGKLYTEYNYSTGAMSNPVDVPGALCEKNKLTLTSEFQFCTDYEDGLYLSEGATLYVPEGERPTIYGACSGLTLSEDNNIGGSSGLYCFGDNTLEIDGELYVIAGGGTNTSSWAVLNVNRDKPLYITGKGSLIAQGGNVGYDDTIVPAEKIRGDSCGLMSYGDLNISIAELFAIGGDSYICTVGMYADYPMTEPHTITISGGANVHARGGLCFGDLINVSAGCAANHIIVKDDSLLAASASDAGQSYGLMIFDWDSYGDGIIELSNGGSIDAAARESSFGSGITSRNTKPVIVKMDRGCAFTAEGANLASIPELSGVTAVADGKTVQYDSEKTSYVDADGNPVKKASFMSSTSHSSSSGGGGGGAAPKYSVSAPANPEHGSVKVSAKNAAKDSKVTVTVLPDEGYKTASVTVKDAKGKELAVTDNGDGTYSFTMPNAKVTVEAEFVPEGAELSAPDSEEARPSARFADVDPSLWYIDGVDYVLARGLMQGTGDTAFEPEGTMTRAMMATALYRLDGSPAAAQAGFGDVPPDAWYANAVAWGQASGILNGYSPEAFGPEDPITREQLAAILYRYAQVKGIDTAAQANLSNYADADAVSDWAAAAVSWANAEGLLAGVSDTRLAPADTATRAQIAAILLRFCQKVQF